MGSVKEVHGSANEGIFTVVDLNECTFCVNELQKVYFALPSNVKVSISET